MKRIIVPIKQVPDMSRVKFDADIGRTDLRYSRPWCHRPGSKPNSSLRYTPPRRMKIHGIICPRAALMLDYSIVFYLRVKGQAITEREN